MNIDVAFQLRDVVERDLSALSVVVFDVLRATTSIAVALAGGVTEIHVFGSITAASEAAPHFPASRLLCGEVNCLAPEGFDMGNSPVAFANAKIEGRPMLLSTTNGTRALIAAAGARAVFCGSLVNARAVAVALLAVGNDVLLLCAGTQGAIAMEDVLGAGAVIAELEFAKASPRLMSDSAQIASVLFAACDGDLQSHLRSTAGGQNVITAGLEADIVFAARLNSVPVVGRATGNPPVIRKFNA